MGDSKGGKSMKFSAKYLPGTGRGTSCKLVEGCSPPAHDPSTTALRAAVPLPVPGRY